MLDCADEPGAVLAALRAGCARVRFTGAAETREKLAEIAAASGAALDGEERYSALDLRDARDARDAEAACRAFLAAPAPLLP